MNILGKKDTWGINYIMDFSFELSGGGLREILKKKTGFTEKDIDIALSKCPIIRFKIESFLNDFTRAYKRGNFFE